MHLPHCLVYSSGKLSDLESVSKMRSGIPLLAHNLSRTVGE